jgi:tetratricopeptide (TPR) repeat protein
VGRGEELQLLKDLFHATVRERKPRLVTLVGQAGIGKSRLGWEFEKYIDGVALTAYWHAGRSPSYGEGISFWALAEMIRERAGIAETDDPDTARAKLTATAAAWLTDAEERRWVEPRLAGLLGLEDMPAGQREELFAAWRTFFERIAERDSVILVFKDLHWADTAMLEFIEHILAWSRDHPIYVVAMTRPDLFERYPAWGGATVRNATTLTLEPLADVPMRELLHGLVPGLPEDAVRTILQRAEGVPLYAVETVRMLIDRGQLVPEGDRYALGGPIDRLAVPETLQALVAARIDANPPEDRALLADGAILGQSFTVGALAGVTERDSETLLAALDRLVRRELLIRDDDPRSPERGQYRFVQAIVREIAYETLSKKDRRAKHLAAARYFEALGDEELAGVLASHYLEAYRATPAGPEAEALAGQARIALRAAADRAASLHSHAVALRHYEDALAVTSDPAEVALLHERASRSAAPVVFEPGIQHARAAAATYREIGDREGELRATAELARVLTSAGNATEAISLLEPVAGRPDSDRPEAAFALAELARAYMLSARDADAISTADRALAAVAGRHEPRVVVEALTTKASALKERPLEAEALLRGAIAIADHEGLIEPGLRARNNMASSLAYGTRSSDLAATLREGADVARRLGMAGWFAQLLLFGALVDFLAGAWDRAEGALDELDGLHLGVIHSSGKHSIRSSMAAYRGDAATARREMAEADRLGTEFDTAPQLQSLETADAETLFALQDYPAALKTAIRSWERIPAYPDPLPVLLAVAAATGDGATVRRVSDGGHELVPARLSTGVLAHVQAVATALHGEWDEARAAYQAALDSERQLELGLHVARLELEFSAFLGRRFDDARRAGESADAFFVSVGAADFSARYRGAFRGTPAPPTGGSDRPTTSPRAAVPIDAEQPA